MVETGGQGGVSSLLRACALAALCFAAAGCAETHLAAHAIKKAQRGMADRDQQAKLPRDNVPRADGQPSLYKVGEPYEIDGKRYYPKEDYKYRETGIASWYGDEFHGRLTANGEVFNMNAVSAAHRTLPMPSVVRVTNLENGRSMVVRVNDRGPFVKDRILDMSHRGADLLGFRGQGTVKVRVEILEDESRKTKEAALRGQRLVTAQLLDGAEEDPAPPALVTAADMGQQPAPPANGQVAAVPTDTRADDPARFAELSPASGPEAAGRPVFVQTGAYAVFDNAVRAQSAIAAIAPATIAPTIAPTIGQAASDGLRLYRVRLGPFASQTAADSALEQVVKRGYAGARIVAD